MPYDVFLSHNSMDKPLVRAVGDWLARHGTSCFLDEDNLEPGDRLTDRLGKAMEESRAAIVFIGPHGEGPWQREEIDTLLNKAIKLSRVKDEFRVIPVLLPDADVTRLRWFLQTRLWVDLSKGVTDSEAELFRLKQAILGKADEAPISEDPQFNPYKGLAAFQEKDANFFFGRAKACRDLAATLKEWRFACVVGPSGNGKSSLARAGLATDAAEESFPGIRSLKRIALVPGGNLLRAFLEQLVAGLPDVQRADAIAKAMLRLAPPAESSTAEQWAVRLDEELRAWFPSPEQRVLFVVDQFEEVFTHRGLLAANEAEREQQIGKALDCLALLATQGDKRWHFVFTLRSDFYQRCRVSEKFWKLVSAERLSLHLDELDEEGWREAIKGPAARAGAYLEAGLIEIMLRDVYRQRGSMPLLQLALHQLWRLRQGACLTHAAYSTLGGVANALQNRAESALQHLNAEKPEYLEIARNIFLRLTALGEGVSDSRRRVDCSEELDWENTDPQDIQHVLAELSNADNRLLTADAQFIEVTHEVLIRECDTIRGWIELARKEIPILRRLTHAARRWEENKRAPVFLNAADPLRELKKWATHTRLRLSRLERVYLSASRTQRAGDLWDKLAQRQALLRSEQEKRKQAEVARSKSHRVASAAIALAVLAAAAGVFAWVKQIESRRAKDAASAAANTAEQALVRSFIRTIGIATALRPSGDEQEALWELAGLDPANRNVRRAVIERWTKSEDLLLRATKNRSRGLHAAIGLDASMKAFSEPLIQAAVHALVVEVRDLPATNTARLSNLEELLTALSGQMTSGDAATVAGRLITALEQAPDEEFGRLGGWRDLLVVMAGRMNSTDASAVAGRLVASLEQPPAKDEYQQICLAAPLATLADRMNPADAGTVAARRAAEPYKFPKGDLNAPETKSEALAARTTSTNADAADLAAALEESQGMDPFIRSGMGEALADAAGPMNPADAAAVCGRGAVVLAAVLENPEGINSFGRAALGKALAALAGRMNPDDAAKVAGRGARMLAAEIENPEDPDANALTYVGQALAALTREMNPTAASAVADRGVLALVEAMENPRSRKAMGTTKDYAEALGSLAERMNPATGAAVAVRLATAMKQPQEMESRRVGLEQGLAGLAARIPKATQTRRAALSLLFLEPVAEVRTAIAQVCAALEAQELTEVLKWPFCLGEPQRLVLVELEKKTHRKFDGDLWKLVELAPALGITNLDAPAKRPQMEDAIKELEAISAAGQR